MASRSSRIFRNFGRSSGNTYNRRPSAGMSPAFDLSQREKKKRKRAGPGESAYLTSNDIMADIAALADDDSWGTMLKQGGPGALLHVESLADVAGMSLEDRGAQELRCRADRAAPVRARGLPSAVGQLGLAPPLMMPGAERRQPYAPSPAAPA